MVFGRYLFGGSAIAFGLLGLSSGTLTDVWQPVPDFAVHWPIFPYLVALAFLGAGTAVLRDRWESPGGYVLVALRRRWPSPWSHVLALEASRLLLGICVVAFGANHLADISEAASFVPAGLPPGPSFWVVVTGTADIATGLAILCSVLTVPAARLLALMYSLFGAMVWLRLVWDEPQRHSNWARTIVTFALSGSAWVLADALAEGHRASGRCAIVTWRRSSKR